MAKKSLYITIVIVSLIKQNQCFDFAKVFHTPKRDYDKLEILERSNFDSQNDCNENSVTATPQSVQSTPTIANAQISVRFGEGKDEIKICGCGDNCQCGYNPMTVGAPQVHNPIFVPMPMYFNPYHYQHSTLNPYQMAPPSPPSPFYHPYNFIPKMATLPAQNLIGNEILRNSYLPYVKEEFNQVKRDYPKVLAPVKLAAPSSEADNDGLSEDANQRPAVNEPEPSIKQEDPLTDEKSVNKDGAIENGVEEDDDKKSEDIKPVSEPTSKELQDEIARKIEGKPPKDSKIEITPLIEPISDKEPESEPKSDSNEENKKKLDNALISYQSPKIPEPKFLVSYPVFSRPIIKQPVMPPQTELPTQLQYQSNEDNRPNPIIVRIVNSAAYDDVKPNFGPIFHHQQQMAPYFHHQLYNSYPYNPHQNYYQQMLPTAPRNYIHQQEPSTTPCRCYSCAKYDREYNE